MPTVGVELNHSNPEISPISSLESDQQQKEAAKKTKKPELLGLQEQLRPLLNSLDIWPKSSLTIDFDFTLRGLLLESALYVVVFEDIPFNLWSGQQGRSCGASNLTAIKKIQQFFMASINESFRSFDNELHTSDNATTPIQQAYSNTYQHYQHYQASQSGQSTTAADEKLRTYDILIEGIKNDVKNAIALKLNDIKSGDCIVKQIADYLKKGNAVSNLKCYLASLYEIFC